MAESSRDGAKRLRHVVEVRLDDEQWQQLQTQAERDHTQAPTIIRQALALLFQTRKTPAQQQ